MENLAKELGVSVKTLRKYLKQLIAHGWLSQIARRNPKTGQLLGGFDYILHSTPIIADVELSTVSVDKTVGNSVDNSTSNHTNRFFNNHQSPNRQNFPTKQTLIINNNLNNKHEVGVSSHVEPVVSLDSIDEVELEAANQYVDNQKGVRDRTRYLICTIKNGWHKQLYEALIAKQRQNNLKRLISDAEKDYKRIDTSGYQHLNELISYVVNSNHNMNQDDQHQLKLALNRQSNSTHYMGVLQYLRKFTWFYLNHKDILRYLPEFHDPDQNKAYQLIKLLAPSINGGSYDTIS
ncbi:MAG: hypothetical protein EKK54_04300 [Neisseriaceae bacterium]|nr:MAG: hypothetical protein EKK54_04300 [Neisseriaceae bacterium]